MVKDRTSYPLIQSLRGVAALWVVLFHASEGGHILALKAVLPAWISSVVFDLGHYGVAIFFALSGFVIAHSLAGVTMNLNSLMRFMLRRSIRLDPTYWAAIAIALFLSQVSGAVKGEPAAAPSVAQIGAHLIYLQEILGFREINSAFWTLTFEIQFYAFFAAMLIARKWALPLMSGLALASALGLFEAVLPGLFISLWGCFFVGVLARQSVEHRPWLLALGALIVALSLSSTFGAISAATALFLYVSVATKWAERGLSSLVPQYLGTISYSLYLVHNPVTGAAGFLGHRALGSGVVADVVMLILIIAASLISATLLWRLIEQPSHRLSRMIPLRREKEARLLVEDTRTAATPSP